LGQTMWRSVERYKLANQVDPRHQERQRFEYLVINIDERILEIEAWIHEQGG
jgi:hypothetical protein